jgi:DNA polymerase III sliding clamp (beta) subunit (PCNA family)
MAASTTKRVPCLLAYYCTPLREGCLWRPLTVYRLAEKQLGESPEQIELLVPVSAMQDLLRIVGDFEGDVGVTSDEQQILFRVGDVELVARLIEGRYPDYRKLIPQDSPRRNTKAC